MTQYLTGADGGDLPWVYLIFGDEDVAKEDLDEDGRVMLDLVAPMLGMRGLGGEIFAMERLEDYHSEVLPRGALEGEPVDLSGRIRTRGPEAGEAAEKWSTRVLSRLERITKGEERFCAYCGKDGPTSQCSRCGKARYCNPTCQSNAWKYHKTWCKVDAGIK